MRGEYLLFLLAAITCIGAMDYRWKLAYFNKPAQTWKILIISLVVFIIWDIAGILDKIFFIGHNHLLIGVRIGQFPVEEIFFLVLLNYSSLIIYLLLRRRSVA